MKVRHTKINREEEDRPSRTEQCFKYIQCYALAQTDPDPSLEFLMEGQRLSTEPSRETLDVLEFAHRRSMIYQVHDLDRGKKAGWWTTCLPIGQSSKTGAWVRIIEILPP